MKNIILLMTTAFLSLAQFSLAENVAEAPKANEESQPAPAEAVKETPSGTEDAQTQPAQVKVAPKKVEVDSNFDGKVDRTEIYDSNGKISRVEADTNGDGKVDDWITYDNVKPSQEQRDSNGDGKVDIWIDY